MVNNLDQALKILELGNKIEKVDEIVRDIKTLKNGLEMAKVLQETKQYIGDYILELYNNDDEDIKPVKASKTVATPVRKKAPTKKG